MENLSAFSVFFTLWTLQWRWSLEQGLRRLRKVLEHTILPIKEEATPKSKWTFWNIYRTYALDGSIWNFWLIDKTALALAVIELVVNSTATYSLTKITGTLNDKNEHVIFYLFLSVGIFSSDITRGAKRVFRKKSDEFKQLFFKKIFTAIASHLAKATPENRDDVNTSDMAYSHFRWTYDNVQNTLVETTIQLIRSGSFTVYILYNQPRLFPVFLAIYVIMWVFILPHDRKKNGKQGDELHKKAYSSLVLDDSGTLNPSVARNSVGDVVSANSELVSYYRDKQLKYFNDSDRINLANGMSNFLLIGILFYTGLYDTALAVFLNRNTLFGGLNALADLKRCEKDSDRSMEKMVEILEKIDAQDKPFEVVQLDHASPIHNLKITNLSQKIGKFVLCIIHSIISLEKNKCLLLDGMTGCGKSATARIMGGLYSTNLDALRITFSNEEVVASEFNQIYGERVYIRQTISDDIVYNGQIPFTLSQLFPCGEMQDVHNFLTYVFRLKPENVPRSMEDFPPTTLSGGERQRYALAKEIWAIQLLQKAGKAPSYVIMDEVDRALDADTAVHIMHWIVTNLDTYFVIISHLTEVKEMLVKERLINQIWNYESRDDEVHVVPKIIV